MGGIPNLSVKTVGDDSIPLALTSSSCFLAYHLSLSKDFITYPGGISQMFYLGAGSCIGKMYIFVMSFCVSDVFCDSA